MKKTSAPVTPPVAKKKPYVKAEPTWIAMLPITLAKEANRHRWQLTPVVASLVVFAAGEAPGAVLTSVITAVLAVLLFVAQKTKRSFRGRMYLSEREREVAALWLLGASLWSLTVLLPLPIWVDAVVLVVATAYPDYRWLSSRKPMKKVKLSKAALTQIGTWADTVAMADGPLKGSKIVRATVREPNAGELTFTVQLRDDVHNKEAVVDACVNLVERLLNLPSECAQLLTERTDAGRIRVTLSPKRHLEQNIVPWNGPEIRVEKVGDGRSFGIIPMGQTLDGKSVEIPAWNKSGVTHGRLCGNTNNGKSSTGRVIISARRSTGNEVVWFIDGGRGQSMPEMENAFDWYAIEDDDWGRCIDSLYDLMVDRQKRYGKERRSAWVQGGKDKSVLCWIEEAPEVARKVGKVRVGGLTRHEKVLAILQNGRKSGISLVQVSQDPMADNLLGGRPARDLMSSGFEVLHKPGGKISQNLAQDSNNGANKVNLLALPNEPGFAAVLVGGVPIAPVARIRHCDDGPAKVWADSLEPLSLTDPDDLRGAGANYARRGTDQPSIAESAVEARAMVDDDPLIAMALLVESGAMECPEYVTKEALLTALEIHRGTVETDDTTEQSTEERSDVQRWIMVSLEMYGPATLNELVLRCEKKTHGKQWKRTHIKNNVKALSEAGSITQGEGSKWQIAA